ncbi:hypothetical protein ACTMU2_04040 [Cupriavidus basilensis]
MKKSALLASLLASALVLAGCGGGDGGATPPATEPGTADGGGKPVDPPAPANTGSVSAQFVAGAAPRYMLLGIGSQSFGRLDNHTQAADSGAVTVINSTTLGGDTSTREISGDAGFAMGRWAKGTVTFSSGTRVLDGVSNAAYHYVLLNSLPAFPEDAAYTCDAGKFTAPTYIGGSNVAASVYTGATTGTATLAFSDKGAAIGVSLTATAGGISGGVSGNSQVATPSNLGITGAFLSGGAGMGLQVADAGDGKALVVAAYKVNLANGAMYQGVATFSCSPQ